MWDFGISKFWKKDFYGQLITSNYFVSGLLFYQLILLFVLDVLGGRAAQLLDEGLPEIFDIGKAYHIDHFKYLVLLVGQQSGSLLHAQRSEVFYRKEKLPNQSIWLYLKKEYRASFSNQAHEGFIKKGLIRFADGWPIFPLPSSTPPV